MPTNDNLSATTVVKQNDMMSPNTSSTQPVEIRRRSLPMIRPSQLLTEIETSHDSRMSTTIIRKMLKEREEYSISRMQQNDDDPRWIITALNATDHNITPWIATQGIQETLEEIKAKEESRSRTETADAERQKRRLLNRIRQMRELLTTYKSICLYLLEKSAFLRDCVTTQERIYLQGKLSTLIENTNQHNEALCLIAAGEHEQFIATLLDNMKKSGFLYHPHKQFKILMTIFKICPKLINEKMGDIFDVIQGWERGNWQTEPFRGAFVEMLEMFINDSRDRIDELAGLEKKDDNDSYTMVVQALAIQLLLADRDQIDRNRNQAMLYRYLMMQPVINRTNLAEFAMSTLCGMPPATLSFQWNETRQVTLLGHRLSAEPVALPESMTPRRYRGERAQVIIDSEGLRLEPLDNNSLCRPVLPIDLLPWHHMQVRLYDEISTPTRNKMRDLSRLRTMWESIEKALFDDNMATQQQVHKVEPEIGDVVHVVIDDTDINDDEVLHCTIVDDVYQGEGWLHVRDIVQWFNYDMRPDYFVDHKSGDPMVFEATVTTRNRYGDLQFRMAQQVAQYISNEVSYLDEYDCVIANINPNGTYTCLSKEGFSFWGKAEGEFDSLKRGTFVRVKPTDIRSANAMDAEILKVLDDLHSFPHEQPFINLMQSMGTMPNEEEDGVNETALTVYEEINHDAMQEQVLLLRRLAMLLPEDYVGTYNYLAMARLLALTINDQRQANLCQTHMRLLQLVSTYVTQDNIATEAVELYNDAVQDSPILQRLYNMLWLVSSIGNSQATQQVWKMSQSDNTNEAQMARMVLSLNMLGIDAVKEQRDAIKTRIKSMLRVSNYDDQNAKYYGAESLHVEFKTSITTPPDTGMRRDVETQTRNIMRVICGMLNADGGTLYLGVRDNGMETGLDEDMKMFKTRDKFDLHVRNNVSNQLGKTANNFVDGNWDDEAKRDVYILTIKRCPHLVTLDGQMWVRQGTSTRLLEGEDLENYKQDRQRLFEQQEKVVTPTIDEGEQPAVTTPVAKPIATPNKRVAKQETIATSRHRNNVLHDYEEGYVPDIIGYVYFKDDNKFEFSPNDIYEEQNCMLTLVIHEPEQAGFLAMVYEDGQVVRVPMREVLEKASNQAYNYGDGKRLVFACPIMSDEALLLVLRDGKDNYVYRAEHTEALPQGNINTPGDTLFDVDFNGIVDCEVIANECLGLFADGMDLPRKQVGYNIKRGTVKLADATKLLLKQAGPSR